jgi:hypothetical protein
MLSPSNASIRHLMRCFQAVPSSKSDARNLQTQGAGPKPPVTESAVAVVCLGGGHYCPRAGDAARSGGDSLLLGHIASNYALDMEGEGWRESARECVDATRRAYAVKGEGGEGKGQGVGPGVKVIALVDKKSFKAPARIALVEFLEKDVGIECVTTSKQAVDSVKAWQGDRERELECVK